MVKTSQKTLVQKRRQRAIGSEIVQLGLAKPRYGNYWTPNLYKLQKFIVF